jgi:hypothetical protein
VRQPPNLVKNQEDRRPISVRRSIGQGSQEDGQSQKELSKSAHVAAFIAEVTYFPSRDYLRWLGELTEIP